MTAAAPIDPRARHVSPWTTREKFGRLFWYIAQATLFRLSWRTMYGWRGWLLRRFGAQVHPSARIRRTVSIEVPWNLAVGADSVIGDHVILYCLGRVAIGSRVLISQYSHLCAGTHDFTRPDLPLVRPPIVVADDVWIAADAFVGPGVTIGTGAVVGARASVFDDLPAWKICVGHPARPIRDREYHGDIGHETPRD
ncbi:MAG: WcaF family extracellular polysaccharide biosynthesis acetyltransferase [Gemmataceae bacterium]|nr:WcaF family extracellular polysaccharide biosynthesis acetyltransferase [Gemmataceae bacterium]